MKSFEARYDGYCPKCEEAIKAGDRVRYEGGFNYRELVHARCQERGVASPVVVSRRPAPVEAETPIDVCQRCFMAKAANGSCGCEQ